MAYAKAKGFSVIGRYVDMKLTGKDDTRPEFQRMLKDSHKGLFKYIIVWQLDRFARNKYASAIHKNTLKKNGVKVLSAKEQINDDPSGILMETMLEGMAEYYSAELAVKVKRGMFESFMKGQVIGGNKIYGYDVVDKKYVVNEKEAEVIRHVFDEYANNKTIKVIIKGLNAKGIRNKKGEPFVYNSLMNILKNPKYIGTLTFGKERRENAIPAIVSKEVFKKVAKRTAKNKLSPAAIKAKEKYRLTFKFDCGYCESPMVADTGTARNGTVFKYYKCEGKKKHKQDCPQSQEHKDVVENCVSHITNAFLKIDGTIDLIAKQVVKHNNALQAQDKLAFYQKEYNEVDRKLDNYIEAIGNGVSVDKIKDKMLELESRKAELQYLIDEERLDMPIPLDENKVRYWFTQFANGDINDPQFKERLIEALVNRVVVFNDKLIISFNVKEDNSEKLTTRQIIKDFAHLLHTTNHTTFINNKNHLSKRFKLFQYGGV